MDFIINAIINRLEKDLQLYSRITVGAMPANGSIAMYVGSGAPQSLFKNKATHETIYATVNAKHKEQQKAQQALEDIHVHLTRLKDYPSGTERHGIGWQITSIATSSAPSFIGQDGAQYLYGSIIKINFYYGGLHE